MKREGGREREFLEHSRNFNRKLIRGPRKREQWRSSLRDEMKGRNPESSSPNKQIRRLRIRGCYNAPGNHSPSLTHPSPSLLLFSPFSLLSLTCVPSYDRCPKELNLNARWRRLKDERGKRSRNGSRKSRRKDRLPR